MTRIAARFQLSDVALRKRCLKHRIPMPGRGYWRKAETGAHIKRVALPRLAHSHPIIFIIRPIARREDRMTAIDQAYLDYETAHPINVPTQLAQPDRETKAMLRDLEGQQPDDYGAIRSKGPDNFQVRIHPVSGDRAMAIADALAKACRDRGFLIQEGKAGDRYDGHAAIVIDGVRLRPVLDERMRRTSYRMTEEQVARRRRGEYVYTPSHSYEPTGELTLKIEGPTTPDSRQAGRIQGTRKSRRGSTMSSSPCAPWRTTKSKSDERMLNANANTISSSNNEPNCASGSQWSAKRSKYWSLRRKPGAVLRRCALILLRSNTNVQGQKIWKRDQTG